jgi:hypothetical protein
MNELVIKHTSNLEKKLIALYIHSGFRGFRSWLAFVKSLDPNIIKVEGVKGSTWITFKSNEYKTWFILRWS